MSEIRDRTYTFAAILTIAIFLLISFSIVNDYGITRDEQENFGIGHKYLRFYLTGHLDFKDDEPQIKGLPSLYNEIVREQPYIIWPFANTLSAISYHIFHAGLKILDPISAHHIIIPILTAFFMWLLFNFVRRHLDTLTAYVAMLLFITNPRIFGDIFNNIKDVPELIFFSASVFFFADWILLKRVGYLYCAFLFWGLALAIKMDAMFVPLTLLVWQAPDIIKRARTNTSVGFRNIIHMIAGFALSLAVVLLCYPPLLASQHDKRYFLFNMINYAHDIGRNPTVSWNLYAPLYVFYSTPVPLLIIFFIGVFFLLKGLRANRLNSLLLIWLLVILGRHCLPGANHYQGLRHFIVYCVPFSIAAAVGIGSVSELIGRLLKRGKKVVALILCMMGLIPNLFYMIKLHPFQTTFFNLLIGGLGGAQAREFPYACDYWQNSYRTAVAYIDQHEGSGLVKYWCNEAPHLIGFYRPLRNRWIRQSGEYHDIGEEVYIFFIPRLHHFSGSMERNREIYERTKIIKNDLEKGRLEVVYRIQSQGGDVVVVCRKTA